MSTRNPISLTHLIFISVFVFALGFLVGQVSEDLRRSEENETYLKMIKQARENVRKAINRCSIRFPERSISSTF